MSVVVIQRVVPHYRVPLFERLYSEFGWVVASGYPQANSHGLSVERSERPWLKRYHFQPTSTSNQYSAAVPLRQILDELAPQSIISEFSLHMSSTRALAARAAIRRGPAVAFWSHGSNMERGFIKPSDLLSQSLRLALLATVDANICYSEEGAEYLRKWLPRSRPVFVAPNTMDLNSFPERYIDLEADDSASPRLLFVGRLTEDKNVPLLVEAFRNVLSRIPKATLTIVGSGPDAERVRTVASGIEKNIEFLGELYDKDKLASLFQRASLFVYAGSIGLAANNALAYGLPVVIFENGIGGIRHHPEHVYVVESVTGLRVRSPGAEALAQKLIEAFSGPITPKKAMAPRLRPYVDRTINLERMIGGFRDLGRHLTTLQKR